MVKTSTEKTSVELFRDVIATVLESNPDAPTDKITVLLNQLISAVYAEAWETGNRNGFGEGYGAAIKDMQK